jgi:hypothetical protein
VRHESNWLELQAPAPAAPSSTSSPTTSTQSRVGRLDAASIRGRGDPGGGGGSPGGRAANSHKYGVTHCVPISPEEARRWLESKEAIGLGRGEPMVDEDGRLVEDHMGVMPVTGYDDAYDDAL